MTNGTMKKTALLVIVTFSFVFSGNHLVAQDGTSFDKGTVVATVGYGFPQLYAPRIGNPKVIDPYNPSKVGGFGPFIVKGDYGIVKLKWGHTIGAGIVLGYNTMKVRYEYSDYYYGPAYRVFTQTNTYNTLILGARGTYHFFTKEKLDCYVSIGVGCRLKFNVQSTTDHPSGSTYIYEDRTGLYSGLGLGIRYYFTKNIGVYSEIGMDMWAPVQAGLALKF
jgi:hypothetical protein